MNWIDYSIIGLLIIFCVDSFRKSFLAETLDFLSFLMAFFLSLRFFGFIGQLYETQFRIAHSIANVLGFISVWFLIETFFFLGVRGLLNGLNTVLKKLGPTGVNHFKKINLSLDYFSFIPAFLRGVVFIAIILVTIGTFPIQPRIKLAVQESRVGYYILNKTQQLEGPLKRVFGGISEDSLSFMTIKPKSNESVNIGFKTTDFSPSPEFEERMIELVNNERVSRGIKALEYRPELTPIGRMHSEDMFTRGYFSHYSPEGKTVADRAQEQNVSFVVIGENLAYAPDLELAHKGLMESKGHRENILSPDFNQIGIGIMDGGVYGLMITQVFSD